MTAGRALLVGVGLALAACTVERAPSSDGAAPAAQAVVERIKQRFPKARGWFKLTAGIRVAEDRGALAPDWETIRHPAVVRRDPAGRRLMPRLGLRADAPMEVGVDPEPGLWVRATPLDAAPVAAEVGEGVVVYPGAYGASDLLYKLTPTHVDEYVWVPDASAPHRFRYRLERGPAVAALRWSPDAVEVIDAQGAARVRIARPFARSVDGTRREGTIRLDGDVLTLDVNLDGLAFPVIIDPDWTLTAFLQEGRFAYPLFPLPGGQALAAGGCSLVKCPAGLGIPSCKPVLSSVERFDGQGAWSYAAPMNQPRFAYAGGPLPDGQVLVAGGCIGDLCSGTTDGVELYDPQLNLWAAGPSLASPRAYGSAAPLPGGDLLVAGGCDPLGCTGSVEIYDVQGKRWRAAAPLAQPRGFHKAVALLDGRVLVTGGCADLACTHVLDGAEVYDPLADRWSSAGTMSGPRASHSATLLADGDVLVVGGCSTVDCVPTLETVDRWSFARGVWAPDAPIKVPRHDHVAARLADTTVVVAGGCAEPGPLKTSCTATSEVYDPDLRRWSMGGPIAAPRAYHAGSTLDDGTVLIAGGCNESTCLTWAELVRPVDGRDGGTPPPVFDLSLPEPPEAGAQDDAGSRDPARAASDEGATPPPGPGPGWEAEACNCHMGARRPSPPAPAFALVLLVLLARRVRRRGR